MPIRNKSSIDTLSLPGLAHQTLAGARDGMKTMEIWMQTLAPGAGTPMHRHDCEEVVVVLAGSGVCEIDGEAMPFGAGATLILPPGVVHRITNNGDGEMWVVAALGAAPVAVETPDRTPINLPWG